jgi:hypothetical protein
MNSDLYASTRKSAAGHNEQRTGERRVAVLASIKSARNLGRVFSIAALLLGIAVAAVLSGFALWPPIVSTPSVIGCLIATICVAWGSAVLLPSPSSGALWFGMPIVIGLVCAVTTREWGGFAALASCMLIPFLSLVFYRSDARRQA